jgi:hypothetical protein
VDPDKLESWLRRARKGAARLRVLACEIGSQPTPVAEWTADEVKESSSPQELVLCACADYCDSKGESVQFRLEWTRIDGTAISNCFHRQAPLEDGSGTVDRNAVNADLSTNRIIAQFMRHDETRERMLIGAIGTLFGSFEGALKLLATINEQQGRQLVLMHQQQAASREQGATEREATEEERTEALARATAWNKLAEFGPLAVQAVLEHVQSGPRTNGAAANGSG